MTVENIRRKQLKKEHVKCVLISRRVQRLSVDELHGTWYWQTRESRETKGSWGDGERIRHPRQQARASWMTLQKTATTRLTWARSTSVIDDLKKKRVSCLSRFKSLSLCSFLKSKRQVSSLKAIVQQLWAIQLHFKREKIQDCQRKDLFHGMNKAINTLKHYMSY